MLCSDVEDVVDVEEVEVAPGVEEEAVADKMESCFFFRNSFRRLAFRLRVEGLIFFLVLGARGLPSLVSREKEKVDSILREKLKALPWLASAWQKAKHCDAKEDSSPHMVSAAVIFAISSEEKKKAWGASQVACCCCTNPKLNPDPQVLREDPCKDFRCSTGILP